MKLHKILNNEVISATVKLDLKPANELCLLNSMHSNYTNTKISSSETVLTVKYIQNSKLGFVALYRLPC